MGTVDINYGLITWSQASEPTGSDVKPFLVWYDTTNDLWKIRNTQNTGWWTMALISGGGSAAGDTGIFGGGTTQGGTRTNSIDTITISSAGNATDFGDLTVALNAMGATSNGTSDRGIFGGGTPDTNVIQYITITSAGNATDFGDLLDNRYGCVGNSNGTSDRGLFAGDEGGSRQNVIDYVTISSASNSSDFGDLTQRRSYIGASSNGTSDRGIFGGGTNLVAPDYQSNIIDYVTISSTGNATDFGDLPSLTRYLTGTSNGTSDRGLFAGGDGDRNTISYVTISSTGDAADFGDLTVGREDLTACSNGTDDRGVFGGGDASATDVNVMDYVTISSAGNATDFGDLPGSDNRHSAGTSNGLQ